MEESMMCSRMKICACCLKESKSLSNFESSLKIEENRDEFIKISECYTNLTNIKIMKSMKKVSKICDDCLFSLKSAYTFKKLCIDNEKQFKQIVSDVQKKIQEDLLIPETQVEQSNKNMIEHINVNNLRNIPTKRISRKQILQEKQDTEFKHSQTAKKFEESNLSYYCSFCGKVFDKLSKCHQHEKRIHIKPNSYTCDLCGKIYFEKFNISIHMRSHTGHRPHKCHLCSKSFLNSTALKAHKNNVHNDKLEMHQCPHCSMKFKLKIALVTHIRIHTGEKSFKCEYCTRSFRVKFHLLEHTRLHTGEKPFECSKEDCSLKFASTSALYHHLQTHKPLQERKHKCEICLKTFIRPLALKHHLKVHNNIRDHCCTLCNAKYTKKASLQTHLLRSHYVLTFKCEICDHQFRKKIGYLKDFASHLTTHPELTSRKVEEYLAKVKNLKCSDLESLETVKEQNICSICQLNFVSKTQLLEHRNTKHLIE